MTEPKTTAPVTTGVRAKLATKKAALAEKVQAFTLPVTGIAITIPLWRPNLAWVKAQRNAKGDVAAAQSAYAAELVKFEGEKLSVADLRELLPADDIMFIVGKLDADGSEDEDEDASGND